MWYVFMGASSFNSDLSSWDVSNVWNMDFKKRLCLQRPAGSFKVIYLPGMFLVLLIYELGCFFESDQVLISFELSSSWDVSNVNKYE